METISKWLVDLSANNHLAFALLTVATTGVVGVLLAVIMEVLFKLLGVQTNKADSLH